MQVIWEDRAENIVKAKKDKNLVVLNWVGSGALVIPLNTQREPLNDKRVRSGRFDGAEPQGQCRGADPGTASRL